MVVVGVHMATKVDGVNLGLAGVSKAGAVPDFQDLLGASELRGIQVVPVDMVNSRMKTTLVVLNSKETVVCHLPLAKKMVWEARVRRVTIQPCDSDTSPYFISVGTKIPITVSNGPNLLYTHLGVERC